MSPISPKSTVMKSSDLSLDIDSNQLTRVRCESMWAEAVCRRDYETLMSLRRYIIFMQSCALTKKMDVSGRKEWLAWLQLRCSLLIRRNRF